MGGSNPSGRTNMVRVVKRSRPRIVIPICVGSNPIMHPTKLHTYMMNNYCAMPFKHVDIETDGSYQVCCRHRPPDQHRKNIKDTPVSEWLQSPYLAEVQSYIIKDEKHPGCKHCWHQESLGVESLRQSQAKEYSVLSRHPFKPELLVAEAAVGNLCNFSCLMCFEFNSSLVLAENQRAGIAIYNQSEFTWTEDSFKNLQEILDLSPRVIHLRGGETFYNKKILNLLKEFPSEKLNKTLLHIITNASIWTPEWEEVLNKFKSVRIMCSVDATGDLFEYMRYPGKFYEVEQNILNIASCKNTNAILHCTVQNLNILYLAEIIEWSKKINVYLTLETLIVPRYLHFSNLPNHLKLQAITSLQNILQQNNTNHVNEQIETYLSVLQKSLDAEFDINLWNEFIHQISRRDSVRGNSHKDFLKF